MKTGSLLYCVIGIQGTFNIFKMAKKGKSGKKKQNKEDKKDTLPEVEKEYYEIQIADLNKKLTRLKTLCAELETENEDCKKKYKILDQDRNDVIAYLKRSLTQKQDEILDLTNRLEALQKEKKTEINKFEGKIQEMEHKYTEMSTTLTAEITLLNGKINSLEEFKIQKENLLRKYFNLEEKLKIETEKNKEHQTLLENQSLIQKESLRADVEKKLLKLSINLQQDTRYRITETTQNAVRENITLNNELNLIIVSWQKLFDQNEALKNRLKTLSNEIDVSFEIKDSLLKKHVIQKQVIDRLVIKQEDMMSKFQTLKNCELHNSLLKKKLKENNKQRDEAIANCNKIETIYNALKIQFSDLQTAFVYLKRHNFELEEKIKEAVMIIKDVIGLGVRRQQDPYAVSEQDEYSTRINLLSTLLKLFDDATLFVTEEVETPEGSNESILGTEWRKIKVSQHQLLCSSTSHQTDPTAHKFIY